MEYEPYQRPREKMIYSGAESLTLVELLQVIIGSGSAKYSSAKLARQVEQLIIRGEVSHNRLLAINGLGNAKTCQIMAALIIGKRIP